MPVDPELLRRARDCPQDLRFGEACKLAEQLGFEEVRTRGSHNVFRHPMASSIRAAFPLPLNLQCGQDGKAKAYQVKQLLKLVEMHNLPIED